MRPQGTVEADEFMMSAVNNGDASDLSVEELENYRKSWVLFKVIKKFNKGMEGMREWHVVAVEEEERHEEPVLETASVLPPAVIVQSWNKFWEREGQTPRPHLMLLQQKFFYKEAKRTWEKDFKSTVPKETRRQWKQEEIIDASGPTEHAVWAIKGLAKMMMKHPLYE
jgi:hypothetical protein